MATEQDWLELERIGGLKPEEADKLKMLRSKGAFPAPLAATGGPAMAPPAPTAPTGETFTSALLGKGKEVLGESLYRTVIQPAADINRFGYGIIGARGPFEEPGKYKERRVKGGVYGAERLPTEAPHGFLENLGAASAPLEAGLLTTPLGRVVFGLAVGTRVATHNDDIADAVEGAGGAVMLAKDLHTAGRLARLKYGERYPKVGKFLLSESERAYVKTKPTVETLKGDVAVAKKAADDLRSQMELARSQAAAVAASAEDAAGRALESAEVDHHAALDRVGALQQERYVPAKEIRDKMYLMAGPRGEEAGQMLQAVEEDVTAYAPPGARTVGASAKAAELASQTEKYERTYEAIGKAKGVMLPNKGTYQGSGSAIVIRRRALQYLNKLIQGQGSTAERAMASELSMLGQKGLLDPQTGELFVPKTPGKWREMKETNPGLRVVYDDVPFDQLSQLYSKARSIALSPREFPASQKVASREYTRMINSMRTSLGALATADPELHQAWLDAQRHIRRVERPFLQETQRLLAPGRTARGAFKLLTADDPTTIERYFKHAKPPERRALSNAILDELVHEFTDDTGAVDRSGLAKRWGNLPQETRHLLAGFSNGAANMVMDEGVVRLRQLREAKESVTTAKGGLSAARGEARVTAQRSERWMDALDKNHKEILSRADAEVKATLQALSSEKSKLGRLGKLRVTAGRKEVQRTLEGAPVMGVEHSGGAMWRRMHYRMALVDLARGGFVRAIAQAAEGKFIFGRAKLVREALETPLESPRGREISAALHAIGVGYLGQPHTPNIGEAPGFRSDSEGEVP